jgi:predicted PurR-regulated permease PerM
MENNLETPQVQSVNPLPQTPQPKIGVGRILPVVISVVIIISVLALSGYFLFMNKTQKTAQNTQVYVQPTVVVSPTITPIPSSYKINTKDTSDNAINQDTQAANQDLNNLNGDLNNVNQSFSDQSTNLQ